MQKGSVNFSELSEPVQKALLQLQKGERSDYFRLNLSSFFANYVFVVVLASWFIFLFVFSNTEKWGDGTFWLGGMTLAAGLMLACNLLTLFRTWNTTLHSFFYITPLYFIQTEFDIITFFPISDLVDLSITHNTENGRYKSTTVVLKFGYDSRVLTILSKKKYEGFVAKLQEFDTRFREEYNRRNSTYFVENNYFFESYSNAPPSDTDFSREMRWLTYGISGVVSLIIFAAAYYYNSEISTEKWVKHSTIPHPIKPTVESAPEFTEPEQTLPINGMSQLYSKKETIAPFSIHTRSGSNYLVKLVDLANYQTCLTVFVRGGMSVNLDVPIGRYEVRYASGEKWYGYSYLFGPDTVYSKADEIFDFRLNGNQVNGYSITLHRVTNGNLRTSTISPESF